MHDLLALIETGVPAAAATGGALYARERAPRLYWSLVGLPAALARVNRGWADTMEACGLTTSPAMWRVLAARQGDATEVRPTPPKLRAVVPTTRGVRLRMRLARGQCLADVTDALPALRAAWRVHSLHASEVRPGLVDLHIIGFDVLRRVVLPARLAGKAELLRIPVAMTDRGAVYQRNYRVMPHGLTLGATLSGKSMYGRNLFHSLAGQDVAVVGIDCKRGAEHTPFAPRLSALATDADSALDLLRVLVDVEMSGRFDLVCSYMGIPRIVPGEDVTADIWGLPAKLRPAPLVLIVDEVAELFLSSGSKPDEARRNEIVKLLIRYAQLGRSSGMFVEVMGQRFGSELGKGATFLRSQLGNRVVHRVHDIESSRMGLGDVSEEAMHAATHLPEELPGIAIAGDTSGRWQRIRTPYRPLAETAMHCAATAHLVPDLPALNAFRPVPPAPVDDLLDDVSVYLPDPASAA
ncbi:FtsK/SpoIIIE domain-containing protein [Streptacidiphilus carbonis]|uniref:FtsK/SpoIIIE domain-containing protein n=1 Tax=Streptacidiphilus carbonis TaxID=105422 RepID=UPI0005AB7356|nr:FtsK/SpoIIIE domain-containing protein [Streptacidiphilus carbonis]